MKFGVMLVAVKRWDEELLGADFLDEKVVDESYWKMDVSLVVDLDVSWMGEQAREKLPCERILGARMLFEMIQHEVKSDETSCEGEAGEESSDAAARYDLEFAAVPRKKRGDHHWNWNDLQWNRTYLQRECSRFQTPEFVDGHAFLVHTIRWLDQRRQPSHHRSSRASSALLQPVFLLLRRFRVGVLVPEADQWSCPRNR